MPFFSLFFTHTHSLDLSVGNLDTLQHLVVCLMQKQQLDEPQNPLLPLLFQFLLLFLLLLPLLLFLPPTPTPPTSAHRLILLTLPHSLWLWPFVCTVHGGQQRTHCRTCARACQALLLLVLAYCYCYCVVAFGRMLLASQRRRLLLFLFFFFFFLLLLPRKFRCPFARLPKLPHLLFAFVSNTSNNNNNSTNKPTNMGKKTQ